MTLRLLVRKINGQHIHSFIHPFIHSLLTGMSREQLAKSKFVVLWQMKMYNERPLANATLATNGRN
jgi:hypothetical protein